MVRIYINGEIFYGNILEKNEHNIDLLCSLTGDKIKIPLTNAYGIEYSEGNYLDDCLKIIVSIKDNVLFNTNDYEVIKNSNNVKAKYKEIHTLRSLGLKDHSLLGYESLTTNMLLQIKENCYVFLKEKAAKSIEELKIESKKIQFENDIDALEEIDTIIEMINSAVNDTSFETLSSLGDISRLWPPILLPSPID